MTAHLHEADHSPEPRDAELTPESVREHLDGVAAFLGGAANVIMQLSLPPVGYGVLESPVDSGAVTVHPLKRLRTTLTYLAVAWMGTEEDRIAYREAVNTSHRPIHSKPSAAVRYNAFDPNLQLWVAACLYWGVDDLYTRMRGPMDPEFAERFYQYSARLGTTLQMRREMWPATRADFYRYWETNLATKSIDGPMRDYFNDLIDLRMIPKPLQWVFSRFHRFTVTALLPQHLRDEMGMEWTDRQERRFRRTVGLISAVATRLPTPLRLFPLNFYLFDMRVRRRLGTKLV